MDRRTSKSSALYLSREGILIVPPAKASSQLSLQQRRRNQQSGKEKNKIQEHHLRGTHGTLLIKVEEKETVI